MSDVCEYARQIAHRHAGWDSLAAAVSGGLCIEPPLSGNVLRNRYGRWRAKSGAPALFSTGRAVTVSDFADESTQPGAVTNPLSPDYDGPALYCQENPPNPFLAVKTPVLKYPRDVLRTRIPPSVPLIAPWGDEDPPPRVTIDSDNHFPHQNPRFQAAKMALLADLKPDLHLNLGDHYDFEGISDYGHDPGSGSYTLQEEFDSSKEYWGEVCRWSKDVEYILGNHEDRLYRTIMENPGFYQLRVLDDWHSLAGIPEKVRIHQFNTQRQIGLVWGEHGHEWTGQNPTHNALGLRGGRVLVAGHTHRFGMYSRTWRDENGKVVRREAWNTGYGAKRPHKAPAVARWARTVPHWQNAFLMAEHLKVDGEWFVQVTPFRSDNDAIVYNGKVYRG